MAATTFSLFPELVPELRTTIRLQAIANQFKDIVDSLPPRAYSTWANRHWQRLTYVGYNTSLPERTKVCLMLRTCDPYDARKMRLDENGFETFANCVPISAIETKGEPPVVSHTTCV